MRNDHYDKYSVKFNICYHKDERSQEISYKTLEATLYLTYEKTDFYLDHTFQSIDDYFNSFENSPMDERKELPQNLLEKQGESRSFHLEALGDFFYLEMGKRLPKMGLRIFRLDLSESPVKTYIVTDYLLNGEQSETTSYREKKFLEYVSKYKEDYEKAFDPEKIKVLPKSVLTTGTDEGYQQLLEKKAGINLDQVQEYETLEIPEDVDSRVTIKTRRDVVLSVAIATILAVVLSYSFRWIDSLTETGEVYLFMGKASYLMQELKAGHLSPMYMTDWYDGYLLFMHSEPMPYYVLAACGWFFGDITQGYSMALALCFFLSCYGCIRMGKYLNNTWVGLGMGIIWFFLPQMISVLAWEGDFQKLLAVSFLPLLTSFLLKYVTGNGRHVMVQIAVATLLIILSDLSVAIVSILGMLVLFAYRTLTRKKSIQLLFFFFSMLLGAVFSIAWLYGAYTNGSIPDFSGDPEGFQADLLLIGLFLVILILSYGNIRYYAFCGILASIGAIYIYSQMIYLAYVAFALCLVEWKKVDKRLVVYGIIILMMSGLYSWDQYVGIDGESYVQRENYEMLEKIQEASKTAEELTQKRLLYLDVANESAYPAYYLTKHGKETVFSNESTTNYNMLASEIGQLKYALYTNRYTFVFDRCQEIGCDTILIMRNGLDLSSANEAELEGIAFKAGYKEIEKTNDYYLFSKKVKGNAVVTDYHGLAIGRDASNIALMYPYFEVGASASIDDYSLEELKKYDKIYLSGINYQDRSQVEHKLKKAAKAGVEIFINMDNIPADALTNRQKLFGVTCQTISFNKQYPSLNYKGQEIEAEPFYKEYETWNTIYLEGLDWVSGKTELSGKSLAFLGTAVHKNLHFLGFNLVYHAIEVGDYEVNQMMDDLFGLEQGQCPDRKEVKVSSHYDGEVIVVESDYDQASVGISYQNVFQKTQGISAKNHILTVGKGKTVIHFDYRGFRLGITISILVSLCYVLVLVLRHHSKANNNQELEEHF